LTHGGRWWFKLAPTGSRSIKQTLLRRLRQKGRLVVPVRIEYVTEGHTTFTPRKTLSLLPASAERR
jgi:protein-L-isoaspartate O-methyltransferase